MKGIILAGGSATRLHPMTVGVCKQLLPVYDKPMIYYPLSSLIDVGVRDILIICNPVDKDDFGKLLHEERFLGKVKFTFAEQDAPRGLPDAYNVAYNSGFLEDDESSILVLGDNIFDGIDWVEFGENCKHSAGFHGIVALVQDPRRYGVVTLDLDGYIRNLEEKPANPKSPWALTGVYYFHSKAISNTKSLQPSKRGELEMVDLIRMYPAGTVTKMPTCGSAWLDAGVLEDYHDAAAYIKAIQHRCNRLVGSPEYSLYKSGDLAMTDIEHLVDTYYIKSYYGESLLKACRSLTNV